jgi:hypothetical protein
MELNGYIILFVIIAVVMIARMRNSMVVQPACETCKVCPEAVTCPECQKTVCPPEKTPKELAIAANEKQVADAMNGKSDAVMISNLSFNNKGLSSMLRTENTSLAACRDQAITRKSAALWTPDYSYTSADKPSNGMCAIVDDQPEAADRKPVWAVFKGPDRGGVQPWSQGTMVSIIPYSRKDVLNAAAAAFTP